MKKMMIPALLLVICLILPMAAMATEPDGEVRWAVTEMGEIPGSWSPLEERTEEIRQLLYLTSDRLYNLSLDGQVLEPSLAVAMPEDVTELYAGTFGIPGDARRGYAFAIDLKLDARWEDGEPITADDWIFTLRRMIELRCLGLDLARLQDYYDGLEKPGEHIVSLTEAGFDCVEDAEDAGRRFFYLDVGGFWGLDESWRPITDRTRLKDAAIPSGVTEMYVSPSYLYRMYLATGASQSVFQPAFIGVSLEPQYVTEADVGIVREDSHRLVLLFREPTASGALAMKLAEIYPLREDLFGDDYATSEATYSACGPYRIVASSAEELILEPNPHWFGRTQAPEADRIRITAHIGA